MLVEIAQVLALDENAPNPFNARTRMRLGLPRAEVVSLGIYDVRGRLVRHLLRSERRSEGFHTVIWDGTDGGGRSVGSGVYFYRLTAGDGSITRRMVVVK